MKGAGKTRRSHALFVAVLAFIAAALALWPKLTPRKNPALQKGAIAKVMGPALADSQFPTELQITLNEAPETLSPRYTLETESQAKMEALIRSYDPDYAAFVAIDAESGRVLSLVSHSKHDRSLGHIALRATFPAASVFKLVTAAAAIDSNRAEPNTVIAFNGANHTLYRRNITQTTINRWTRYMTLKEAFAKSVNTVFGKIGMNMLEPGQLEDYAKRFKFNSPIETDLPVEQGKLAIDADDRWALAEVASGFNRVALMSPLQGALMAAAVANDGVMMEPYLVEYLMDREGNLRYKSEPKIASVTMTPQSASKVRDLMRATVHSGTGRKSFRDLLRKRGYRDIDMGGKSGSLTGLQPKGKCDWFVGYAIEDGRRIAMAALTINERQWKVKSAYLARKFIEISAAPPPGGR